MHYLRLALVLVIGLLMGGCSTANQKTNKLPFGFMDTPRTGDTLKGTSTLAGWALSEVGIKEIAVYLDRSYFMSGQINTRRPDVAKEFPIIPNSENSGWTLEVDTSTIEPGQHELVLRAIDNNDSTRDIGSVLVTIAR